jgi:hypothetical protein
MPNGTPARIIPFPLRGQGQRLDPLPRPTGNETSPPTAPSEDRVVANLIFWAAILLIGGQLFFGGI